MLVICSKADIRHDLLSLVIFGSEEEFDDASALLAAEESDMFLDIEEVKVTRPFQCREGMLNYVIQDLYLLTRLHSCNTTDSP